MKKVISCFLSVLILTSVFAGAAETSPRLVEQSIDDQLMTEMREEIRGLEQAGDIEGAIYRIVEFYDLVGVHDDAFASLALQIVDIKEAMPAFMTADVESQVEVIENILSRTYSVSYDAWSELTFAEKTLVITMPSAAVQVNACREWAYNTTESYYNRNGSGDVSDAFRHAYWNALMEFQMNETIAKQFADAHEQKGSSYMSKVFSCGYTGQQHTDMDLHNNQMGRDACTSNLKTYEAVMNAVLNSIRSGDHMTIHTDFNCT